MRDALRFSSAVLRIATVQATFSFYTGKLALLLFINS